MVGLAVRVQSVTPAPGAALTSKPGQVQVTFTDPVLTTSLYFSSISLGRVRPNQTIEEIAIQPSFSPNLKIMTLSMSNSTTTVGAYRLRLKSSMEEMNDYDAALMAMETSDTLRPPSELAEQISNDLAAMRQVDPRLTAIGYRPRTVPSSMFIILTTTATQQYNTNQYTGLALLDTEYGPVSYNSIGQYQGQQMLRLNFTYLYNSALLASIYGQAEGVALAEANFYVGGSSTITTETLSNGRSYTWRYRWGDCYSGCIHEHEWTYLRSEDISNLVSEGGDQLTDAEPLRPVLVLGTDQTFLDGEYSGSFPSGDGSAGGDFVSEFTVYQPTEASNWELYR